MSARHTREASPAESATRIAPSDPPDAPGPAPAPGAPRQVSERKLRANRANAARSTGPRTDAGKAASRMNALQHGLTAQTAVLAGEHESELRELARQLRAGLGPAHGAESVLVGRIVAVEWKLRRLASAEHAACAQEERNRLRRWEVVCKNDREWPGIAPKPGPRPGPRDAGEILAAQFFRKPADAPLLRMAEHEARLTATLLHTVRDLQRLRRDRDAEDRPAGEEKDEAEAKAEADAQGEPDAEAEREPAPQPKRGSEPEQEVSAPPPPPPPPPPPLAAPLPDAPSTATVEKPTTVAPARAAGDACSATEPGAAADAPAAQNEPTAAATESRPAVVTTSNATIASDRPPPALPGPGRSPPRKNEPTARQRNGPLVPPHQGPHAPARGP